MPPASAASLFVFTPSGFPHPIEVHNKMMIFEIKLSQENKNDTRRQRALQQKASPGAESQRTGERSGQGQSDGRSHGLCGCL
jgi:hypothetical protein